MFIFQLLFFLRAFHVQHLSKFLPTQHMEGQGHVKQRKSFVDMLRVRLHGKSPLRICMRILVDMVRTSARI
jgi:hypothetical protein